MSTNRRNRGVSPVAVQAVLMGLALIVAYLTWTRDKTKVQQNETVVALDVGKRDIDSLVYEDDTRKVEVERKLGDKGENYAWVTTTTRSKTLVTKPATTPATPPAPAPAPTGMPAPAKALGAASPQGPAPAKVPVVNAPAAGAKKDDKGAPKGGDKAAADKDTGEKKPPGAASPATTPASAKAPVSPPGPAAQIKVGPAAAATPGAPPAATPPPAAGAIPTPPGVPIHEVKETTTVKSFRGNESAEKLLESFSPLEALRSLGKVDDAKAKELGLSESKKSLTIVVKGTPQKWIVGNTSYCTGDVYVRDSEGRVFLLPQRLTSDFEYAESRLMERRLHRFERTDITRVEVTIGNKKREIVQQKRQDPTNFYWAPSSAADKKDETLSNWMDKVLRLAITDYVPKGEEPQGPGMSQPPGPSGVPQYGEVMSIHFFDGKKEIGHAEFSRYPKGTQTEYYARTETTVGLVRLLPQSAETAITDAEKW